MHALWVAAVTDRWVDYRILSGVSLFYPPVLPTPESNLFSLMKNYEAQLHRLILFHVLVKVEELWRTLKKKTTPN